MKKFIINGLCAAMVLASTAAFAGDVVVTPKGKRYHSADCPIVKEKAGAITLSEQEARERGLTPCKKCLGKKGHKESSKKDRTKESNKKEKTRNSKKDGR